MLLTQGRLKELFSYNPDTGEFTRLVNSSSTGRRGDVPGYKNNCGYIVIGVDGKQYLAHRLIWLFVFAKWPTLDIDHINGITSDNRLKNIREASKSENQQNRIKPHKNNKSNFLGVCKNGNNWRATIKLKGKFIHLGTYKTKVEAHDSYLMAKRKIHSGCTI